MAAPDRKAFDEKVAGIQKLIEARQKVIGNVPKLFKKRNELNSQVGFGKAHVGCI